MRLEGVNEQLSERDWNGRTDVVAVSYNSTTNKNNQVYFAYSII